MLFRSITWTSTTPGNYGYSGLAFGNGVFSTVAYGGNSTAVYSTNGITWTTFTMTGGNWYNVAFGNGIFVTVSSSTSGVAYSTNGITWAYSTSPLPVSNGNNQVGYGNLKFVAVNSSTTTAAYSTNGITWTLTTMPSAQAWVAPAYQPSYAPATTNANYIAYNNTVPGNSTVTIKAGYTLPTAAGIRVKSTNGTSTFSTFGAEIS